MFVARLRASDIPNANWTRIVLLAEELCRRGNYVLIVNTSPNRKEDEPLVANSIRARKIDYWSLNLRGPLPITLIGSVMKFVNWPSLGLEQFDAVWVYMPAVQHFGPFIGKLLGRFGKDARFIFDWPEDYPMSLTRRPDKSLLLSPVLLPLRHIMLRLADVVTISHQALERQVSKTYGATVSKIRVLADSTDTRLFSPTIDGSEVRRKLGLGGFVLLRLGWFRFGEKPLEPLIPALKILISRMPDVQLLSIGGSSNAVREARETVEANGLSGKVVVLDSVPLHELPQYIAAADAYILYGESTLAAPTGRLSVVMAMGKPVISTYFPTAKNILLNGQNCVMIQSLDDLGSAVEKLRNVPNLAESLAVGARKTALSLFEVSAIAEEFLKLTSR